MGLIYKDEVYAIIGAAMEVHRELGAGFLEAVYQEALEKEFQYREIPYQKEYRINIYYKDILLSRHYEADFFCFDRVIVELKALSCLCSDHEAQLLNYLKATRMRAGVQKDGPLMIHKEFIHELHDNNCPRITRIFTNKNKIISVNSCNSWTIKIIKKVYPRTLKGSPKVIFTNRNKIIWISDIMPKVENKRHCEEERRSNLLLYKEDCFAIARNDELKIAVRHQTRQSFKIISVNSCNSWTTCIIFRNFIVYLCQFQTASVRIETKCYIP